MKDVSPQDARALPPIRHTGQKTTSSVSGPSRGNQSTHRRGRPSGGILGGWDQGGWTAAEGPRRGLLCCGAVPAVVHVEKVTHPGKFPRFFVVLALRPSMTGGKGEGKSGCRGTAGFLQQDLMGNAFSVWSKNRRQPTCI